MQISTALSIGTITSVLHDNNEPCMRQTPQTCKCTQFAIAYANKTL